MSRSAWWEAMEIDTRPAISNELLITIPLVAIVVICCCIFGLPW